MCVLLQKWRAAVIAWIRQLSGVVRGQARFSCMEDSGYVYDAVDIRFIDGQDSVCISGCI